MTVEEGCDFFAWRFLQIRDKMADPALGLARLHQDRPAGDDAVWRRSPAGQTRPRNSPNAPPAGHCYILDEPTTGLALRRCAQSCWRCSTRWSSRATPWSVIEHNLEVIKTADWVLDLGPEGGDGGGELVACGSPEDIAREEKSYTGQFLKTLLQRQSGNKRPSLEAAE